MEKTDIKSLDYEELQQFMLLLVKSRFGQSSSMSGCMKTACRLDEMTNLSKGCARSSKETTDYTFAWRL